MIPRIVIRAPIEKINSKADAKLAALNEGVHQSGFMLEAEIKSSIAGQRAEPRSVDTGLFLSSVNTDVSVPYQAVVYSRVPYAKYLEFGTSRGVPRRHFFNSAMRMKSAIAQFIKRKLADVK